MSTRTFPLFVVAFVLSSSLAVLGACSSDDPPAATPGSGGSAGQGSGGGGNVAGAGSTTGGAGGQSASGSTRVTAAAGGKVVDPAGKATLTVPPGALAADTDITLAIGPEEAGTAGEVIQFGPDGTTFSTAATLVLKADAAKLPQGKTYALATFDAGAWTEIAGSTFASGVVTGPVAHFSKFSVILKNGDVIAEPAGECKAILASFAPCGGDLIGTWVTTDICAGGPLAPDPFNGTCPDAVITAEITRTAEVSFDGTTFTSSAATSKVTTKASFPTTCLGNGKTCAQAQADIVKSPDTTGTCVDTAGTCNCDTVQMKQSAAKAMPYTLGDKLFVHEGKSTEYCVSGTTLLGRDVGSSLLTVLKKK